jgi:hypothetical protein
VWKTEGLGATTNLKLQTYKGEQYVTFWTGKKGGTMGRGVYHMVSPRKRTDAFNCQNGVELN